MQGEGGFYIAPPKFVEGLKQIADRHGILLIADEVQTGAGRTGTWFACEQWTVAPDLIATAKSLAGGFPLSGVVGRADVMDAPAPGGLGGTYAGSPVGCAAALAVLKAFEGEQLLERSKSIGATLVKGLRRIAEAPSRRSATCADSARWSRSSCSKSGDPGAPRRRADAPRRRRGGAARPDPAVVRQPTAT